MNLKNTSLSQAWTFMIDCKLVEKKLRNIENFVKELTSVNLESAEAFSKNIIVKRFIERNIELAIIQMIDICKHLISALKLAEPESYAHSIDILAQEGIIPVNHVKTFKEMFRFRNMLIHIYDNVNEELVYDIYKRHLEDFNTFVNIIRDGVLKKNYTP